MFYPVQDEGTHVDRCPPAAPPSSGGGGRARARRAGFTLVEVWVGLMVAVVIAGVSLAAFRGKTKLQTLRRGQATLAADLRAMQQWSQGGKTFNLCTNGVGIDISFCPADNSCNGICSFKVPAGGYGVHVSQCSSPTTPCAYQLFADLNDDGQYDEATELLPGGGKVLELPVRIGLLEAVFQTCTVAEQAPQTADALFAAYTGSASLQGTVSGCGGYGSSGNRVREIITVEPAAAGATVQIIVHAGSGGIQER